MPTLFIIINNTSDQFYLRNAECGKDNMYIQPGINFTSGQNDRGCDIPDCSAQKYFDDHNMSLTYGNNKFWFWNNDKDDHNPYYTKLGNFDSGTVIPGGTNINKKKAIIITKDYTLEMKDINEKED
jgi:hypothetical protein